MPQTEMLKKLKLNGSMMTYKTFRSNTQKRCPFHYRGLNAKVGSQEIPGVTGKFGHGVQNEAGQRLTEICQENALIITNTSSNNTRKDSTYGHCQRVNMKSD